MDNQDWRPIETAPDDAFVLVWRAPRYLAVAFRSGHHFLWVRADIVPGELGLGFEPTHWLPIPVAPGAFPRPPEAPSR